MLSNQGQKLNYLAYPEDMVSRSLEALFQELVTRDTKLP